MPSGTSDIWSRVAEVIDGDTKDLVELCLQLSGIESPHGKEMTVAKAVVDWFQRNGIEAYLQPITQDSANAVGVIHGTGKGQSLIFDAHIDNESPENIGSGPFAKRMQMGFVEGDMIYGHGIVNDKAQVAAFMIAARALRKAKVELGGSLTIAAVASETGEPSVDEFQGIDRPGSGFGSKWLVDRGMIADYALVGETSNFGIVAVDCGHMELKIKVPGRPLYTPRLVRGKTWQESPSAFVKASHVAMALEEWSVRYEEREKQASGGRLNPKAQILAIRGSEPSGLGSRHCNLYFDVWIRPEVAPNTVLQEIRELVNSLNVQCDVSPYQWNRGHEARNADRLIEAVKQAHNRLFGSDPPKPPPATLSMWRDINVFNEVGIPSICYGAARQAENYTYERNRAMKISDLATAAKVYAFTAVSICNGTMSSR